MNEQKTSNSASDDISQFHSSFIIKKDIKHKKDRNRHRLPSGKGGGGQMDWGFGISRCQLLHMEWINNKVLLYSIRNYMQYPMIKHNGKEYKKECVKKKKECV